MVAGAGVGCCGASPLGVVAESAGVARGPPIMYARWYSGSEVGRIQMLLLGLLPPVTDEASSTLSPSLSRADRVSGEAVRPGVPRKGETPAVPP